MKNRFLHFTLLLSLCAFLFSSCSFFAEKPSKNAEKFLNHFYAFEFEEAKQYSTKSTGELLDALKGFVAMLGEEDKKKRTITIVGETMEGDAAVVTYEEEGSKEPKTLKMVKEEGKWLASMTKEDLNKEEEMGSSLDAFEAEMEDEMPIMDSMEVTEDY